jgi:anthranilate phosphoribosyltransferase
MKALLYELIDHQVLTKQSAEQALLQIAQGSHNPSQVAAFMTVFMMRPVTVAELEGFRDAMLALCLRVHFDRPVMDVCGTGGDGRNTFNISTLASFVVAAAGQPVAKHGNYGVSSACGSSNVLEYLGYRFTNDVDLLKRSLDVANICFMHAPLFHPAMKHVAPIRKELGVKTFFNMLGPMVNPALPSVQLVGVFSMELARQYAYLYQQTTKQFAVLHALDGYDEISLTGDFKYYTHTGEFLGTPSDFGFAAAQHDQLQGGDNVPDSAAVFLRVLRGEGSEAQNNAVCANAALAFTTAGKAATLAEGAQVAADTLLSGKAYVAFEKFMDVSKRHQP